MESLTRDPIPAASLSHLPPTLIPPDSARLRMWRRTLLFALPLATLVFVGLFVSQVHPFLAITQPTPATVLVVEGWLPDYALETARQEFISHPYHRLFTTGGPLEVGSHLAQYQSYAELAHATLDHLGIPNHQSTAIPAPRTARARTFHSALALRDHCLSQGIDLEAVNIITLGAHARRSRLNFQQALGPNTRVGVIAVPDASYDPDRWWAFSQGVKTVAGESIAWLYARLSWDPGR